MSNQKRKPQNASFPTFGKCFATVAQALGLGSLQDVFSSDKTTDSPHRAVRLDEWASEKNGPPHSHDFQRYIAQSLQGFSQAEDLHFILQMAWADIVDCHRGTLKEHFAHVDSKATRAWYALAISRAALEWLTVLQLQLKRLFKSGPMLEIPLNQLLSALWADEGKPLTQKCLAAFIDPAEKEKTEPKTLTRWLGGEHHPAYAVLGTTLKGRSDLEGVVINFAFARLLENLSETLDEYAPKKGRTRFYKSLIHQAQSLKPLYGLHVQGNSTAVEYWNALAKKRNERVRLLELFTDYDAPEAEAFIPDDLHAAIKFEREYLSIKAPAGLGDFLQEFDITFLASAPHMKTLLTIAEDLEGQIGDLKKDYPKLSKQFAAPISCVKARLRLINRKLKPQQRLKIALCCYREAAEGCIYNGGPYTELIIKEAMGFTAWVYEKALSSSRGKSGDEIKPFLCYCYNWLNLLGQSEDFDHLQEAQRIDLAIQYFIGCLSPELREHLEANIRDVEFYRTDFTSAITFLGYESFTKLKSTPINKQRTKPFSKTLTGLEQTPLMEAIDRRQLDYAHELVETEEDLNFINSTGDNAVTKAFAARDYDLILRILHREQNPITRATLLSPTKKHSENVLSLAISHGRVEILKELLFPSVKERESVDPNQKNCLKQTPLYFAVNALGFWNMDFETMLKHADAMLPKTKAMQALRPPTEQMSGRRLEILQAVVNYNRANANVAGIEACFNYLVGLKGLETGKIHHAGRTALTFALEAGLTNLAVKLREAGADESHTL